MLKVFENITHGQISFDFEAILRKGFTPRFVVITEKIFWCFSDLPKDFVQPLHNKIIAKLEAYGSDTKARFVYLKFAYDF